MRPRRSKQIPAQQSTTFQGRLDALERLVTAQQNRIARQDEELARLRATVKSGSQSPVQGAKTDTPQTRPPSPFARATSRRSVLKFGGAAAAAGVAAAVSLASNSGTAHASGVGWATGTVNADTATLVQQGGSWDNSPELLELKLGTGTVFQPVALKAALTAYDTTTNNIGVYGTSSTGFGLFGATDTGSGANGAALHGSALSSGTGVSGISGSGTGVLGSSMTGIGGSFTGGQAPLAIGLAGSLGAPTSGTHVAGEIFGDNAGHLWLCTSGGTPGTWVRVGVVSNNSAGGSSTFLPTPVRLLETRPGFTDGATNKGSPLVSGTSFTFPVAGKDGIPSSATGVMGTITALSPSAGGNLKLWPAGASEPNAVAVVAQTVEVVIAGFTMSGLGSGGQVTIIWESSSGATVNVVFDAVGYTL